MASGPCLRRCRVVRRYIPIKVQFYRLSVKQYHFIHVSMSFEPLWEGNTVNTGVPCPKVPMHRKLGSNDHKPKHRQEEDVSALTFSGRMVQPMLPKGFHRMRYDGLQATGKAQKVKS